MNNSCYCVKIALPNGFSVFADFIFARGSDDSETFEKVADQWVSYYRSIDIKDIHVSFKIMADGSYFDRYTKYNIQSQSLFGDAFLNLDFGSKLSVAELYMEVC